MYLPLALSINSSATTTVTTTVTVASPYDLWLLIAEIAVALAIIGEAILGFFTGGRRISGGKESARISLLSMRHYRKSLQT